MVKRIGDLNTAQDLQFQEREWVIQRLGWTAMVVVIILALLGVFGTGPFSATTAGEADGPLSVAYQRFLRQDSSTTVTIRTGSDHITTNKVEVWLDADYLASVEVERISPQPNEVREGEDRLTYVFAIEDMTQPFEVRFSLRPQHIGRLSGEAGVIDGPSMEFDQFSYP